MSIVPQTLQRGLLSHGERIAEHGRLRPMRSLVRGDAFLLRRIAPHQLRLSPPSAGKASYPLPTGEEACLREGW